MTNSSELIKGVLQNDDILHGYLNGNPVPKLVKLFYFGGALSGGWGKRVAICREKDGFGTIPRRAHRGSMRRGGRLVAKSWTPWSVARQAPLSIGFPRQEYWSGLTLSSPEGLPKPGVEPESLALQAVSCIASRFFVAEPPGKPSLRTACC